jgi:hypothetical protein
MVSPDRWKTLPGTTQSQFGEARSGKREVHDSAGGAGDDGGARGMAWRGPDG